MHQLGVLDTIARIINQIQHMYLGTGQITWQWKLHNEVSSNFIYFYYFFFTIPCAFRVLLMYSMLIPSCLLLTGKYLGEGEDRKGWQIAYAL